MPDRATRRAFAEDPRFGCMGRLPESMGGPRAKKLLGIVLLIGVVCAVVTVVLQVTGLAPAVQM